MLVCVDPGHGGIDPGAIGGTLRESDINFIVAFMLANELYDRDIDVQLTRGFSETLNLDERCWWANASNADLFISIHCNASEDPKAHGTETYHYQNSAVGKRLAKRVHEKLVGLGLRDRGVKPGNFYILKNTKMPAILVEIGFISNPEERKKLNSVEFLLDAAVSIADAVTESL